MRRFRHRPTALAFILSLAIPAASAHAADPSGTLTTVFENDLFYRTDRDYTNGIEFNWSPAGSASELLPEFLANMTPGLFPRDTTRVNYSLGQLMFTPEDTAAYDPPLTQRPYAGYLYGALALTSTGPGTEEQLRIQLGAVGPASLAADSQDLIHRLRGFALPQGWHTQLRDEPGLDGVVPDYLLASYLGITPVHLSRLRTRHPAGPAAAGSRRSPARRTGRS